MFVCEGNLCNLMESSVNDGVEVSLGAVMVYKRRDRGEVTETVHTSSQLLPCGEIISCTSVWQTQLCGAPCK